MDEDVREKKKKKICGLFEKVKIFKKQGAAQSMPNLRKCNYLSNVFMRIELCKYLCLKANRCVVVENVDGTYKTETLVRVSSLPLNYYKGLTDMVHKILNFDVITNMSADSFELFLLN